MKTVQGNQPAASERLREDLQQALSRFASGPLRESAKELLNALGYRSERTDPGSGDVDEFLDTLDADAKHREALGAWRGVEIVFQVTVEEIDEQKKIFEQTEFDKGRIQSFLFLAVDLHDSSYNRTRLSDMTRAVNRLFAMPVIVLYRYASTMTLAVIHRRAHKKDDARDVLEKVTLIKDVDLANPHRAHLGVRPRDRDHRGGPAREPVRQASVSHALGDPRRGLRRVRTPSMKSDPDPGPRRSLPQLLKALPGRVARPGLRRPPGGREGLPWSC